MTAMKTISDDDLVLYHYRDGLDATRIAEIELALSRDAGLHARHQALTRTLGQVGTDATPALDEAFEQRLWHALAPRIDAIRPPLQVRLREWLQGLAPPRAAWAGAAALLVALGLGYYAGRSGAPAGGPMPGPLPAQVAGSQPQEAAARVLAAYVSEHLRATEGLLLTASNADSAAIRAGNREVAHALVDSNRLYALAAARAGNLRLADFLRQLEPVLLDLANQPADASIESTEGLREYLRKTDLLFQVRATQAQVESAETNRI